MAFPPLGISDHHAVSVFIDFPISSVVDAVFHHSTLNYSSVNWNGVPGVMCHSRIYIIRVLLLLLPSFVSEVRLKM